MKRQRWDLSQFGQTLRRPPCGSACEQGELMARGQLGYSATEKRFAGSGASRDQSHRVAHGGQQRFRLRRVQTFFRRHLQRSLLRVRQQGKQGKRQVIGKRFSRPVFDLTQRS